MLANHFKATITFRRENGAVSDGRNMMGLLTLVAACGSTVEILASGPDARAAVDALADLIENGFGEGVCH
jgi:phosphotransferase system HPr (HPr) family protein